MKVTPQYKCRRCSAIFEVHTGDNDSSSVYDLKCDLEDQILNNGYITLKMRGSGTNEKHKLIVVHECKDERIGFADIIGAEIEP
ncbi:MAG TPA: hypothetical protein VGK06_10595 [Methanosarcina sp.]|jgi:hypothetical protein